MFFKLLNPFIRNPPHPGHRPPLTEPTDCPHTDSCLTQDQCDTKPPVDCNQSPECCFHDYCVAYKNYRQSEEFNMDKKNPLIHQDAWYYDRIIASGKPY